MIFPENTIISSRKPPVTAVDSCDPARGLSGLSLHLPLRAVPSLVHFIILRRQEVPCLCHFMKLRGSVAHCCYWWLFLTCVPDPRLLPCPPLSLESFTSWSSSAAQHFSTVSLWARGDGRRRRLRFGFAERSQPWQLMGGETPPSPSLSSDVPGNSVPSTRVESLCQFRSHTSKMIFQSSQLSCF